MDITAQDTFTPAVLIQGEDTFDISVSGTFVATVVVQRSKDSSAWVDLETFTVPTEKSGRSGSAWYYRMGVKTGGFTSGTIKVELFA